MKIHYITENLDPTMGAASYNVQGANFGYTHNILSMNHNLEQPMNKHKESYYIHPGCVVQGSTSDNDKIEGRVVMIIKNEDGSIKKVKILTKKSEYINLNPDSVRRVIYNDNNSKTKDSIFNISISHNIKI